MEGGLVTDDIYHFCICPAGIVQVGDTVGETWSAVKQRYCRFPRHPRITVSTTGDNGLGHSEYAAHALNPIKSNDEMYFRGAGIGKANFNIGGNKGANQAFCAVHAILTFMESFLLLKKIYPFCHKVSMPLGWKVTFWP
jgi:hypothetical protein